MLVYTRTLSNRRVFLIVFSQIIRILAEYLLSKSQHMKQLLAILLGVAAVTGFASAAELPADPLANANQPTIPAMATVTPSLQSLNIRRIPRPSIRSVLDRRPALP